MVFWMLGWVGAGCVWLFFGVFGGGAGCVWCGVVLEVFRYVGEPIICPCQCVMHFGADFYFWGFKINLWGLFLGLRCGCERVLVDWWQGVGVTSRLLRVVQRGACCAHCVCVSIPVVCALLFLVWVW